MDKGLDKTRMQMTILFVWAYGRVLDPTLCLCTGSYCDIVATPWIGDVPGPADLREIYERDTHFQWCLSTRTQSVWGLGAGGTLPRWETHPTLKFEFNKVSIQEFWETVSNGSKPLGRSGRRR